MHQKLLFYHLFYSLNIEFPFHEIVLQKKILAMLIHL